MTKSIKRKKTTAYSILKGLGPDAIRKYIHETIPDNEFDSHLFIASFLDAFPNVYSEMLAAHSDAGDVMTQKMRISNLMGNYLGINREALNIVKIGKAVSENINKTETPNSLWQKTN